MQAPPAFGFQQLVPELLRGLAEAVSERPGESESQRFGRHQTAIFSVMALWPRDATEAILASHCVMYDHVLRDATHDLLRAEAEPVKRRIRSQLLSVGRLFLQSLGQLDRLQTRAGQPAASVPSTAPEPPLAAAPPSDTEAVDQPPTEFAEPGSSQPSAAPGSPPPPTSPGDNGDALVQRGFQNRQMRRAQQFKKPARQSALHRLAQTVMASHSPAITGQQVT
jgi:hypothetical protein